MKKPSKLGFYTPRRQTVAIEAHGRRIVLSRLRLSRRQRIDIDPRRIVAILNMRDDSQSVPYYVNLRRAELAVLDATPGRDPLSVVVLQDNRAVTSAIASRTVARHLLGEVRDEEVEADIARDLLGDEDEGEE